MRNSYLKVGALEWYVFEHLRTAERINRRWSVIARLLKLRKLQAVNHRRKLKVCAVNTHVWGVFLVTGLDKIFDVCDDVASGLASLQLDR